MISVRLNNIYCISQITEEGTNQFLGSLLGFGKRYNGITLNAGEEPSIGYLLMVANDLTSAILQSKTLTLTIRDDNTKATITYRNLQIIETRRFTPNNTRTDLVLVTISDARYTAKRSQNGEGGTEFPSNPNLPSSLPASWTSWSTGLNALWSRMGMGSYTLDLSQAELPSTVPYDVTYDATQVSAWRVFFDLIHIASHDLYQTESGYRLYPHQKQLFNAATKETELIKYIMAWRRDTLDRTKIRPGTINVRFRNLIGRPGNEKRTVTIPGSGSHQEDFWCHAVYLTEQPLPHTMALNALADSLANLRAGAYRNHAIFNGEFFCALPIAHCPQAHTLEYYHDLTNPDPLQRSYRTRSVSIDIYKLTMPVLDIRTNPPNNNNGELVRFKLLEPLNIGETASASIVDCGCDPIQTIEVYDIDNLADLSRGVDNIHFAPTNSSGTARYCEGEYHIVSIGKSSPVCGDSCYDYENGALYHCSMEAETLEDSGEYSTAPTLAEMAGDCATNCSFRYTLRNTSGFVIATGVDLNDPVVSNWRRMDNTKYHPATHGSFYELCLDPDREASPRKRIILNWCNERPVTSTECTDTNYGAVRIHCEDNKCCCDGLGTSSSGGTGTSDTASPPTTVTASEPPTFPTGTNTPGTPTGTYTGTTATATGLDPGLSL